MPSKRKPAGDQAHRNGSIKCRWLVFALVMVSTSFGSTCSLSGEETRAVAFNRDVRPILSDKCFACHGFDQKTREAELRLDTREGARESREGGAAIVAGDPEKSLLLRRIHSEDPTEVMPPPETNKRLTDNERTCSNDGSRRGLIMNGTGPLSLRHDQPFRYRGTAIRSTLSLENDFQRKVKTIGSGRQRGTTASSRLRPDRIAPDGGTNGPIPW